MTLANQELAGQFVHSIRRTARRQFFLRPGFRTNWTLHYAFAVAVEKSGVVPSAEVTMSNHRHGGLLDVRGNRAEFHERYHGMVGQKMNWALNRQGNHFWDNRGAVSIICLLEPGRPEYEEDDPERKELDRELEEMFDRLGLDIQDRMLLYIWMNPVKANLVRKLRRFPGFTITPDDWGKEVTVRRPPWFDLGYPPKGTYTPMPPKKWEGRLDDAKRFYNALIELCEEFYAERRTSQGKGVLGKKGLLRLDPFDRPKSPSTYRRRRPRFAGSSKARVKAYDAYGQFLENHRGARRKLRSGKRNVVFPAGTVRLRRHVGVRCRGTPLPSEDPMP